MGLGCRRVIVLFGPPGVGKGVQAKLLRQLAGWRHLSTGEVLREEIAAGTELGHKVRAAVERGGLADDATVVRLVTERLQTGDPSPDVLLDGFPRNLNQARELDNLLGARGQVVNRAILLEAPEEVIVERLAGRRVCERCAETYHIRFRPPAEEGVCDRCQGRVLRRPDDDPDTHRERLRVYRERTSPLVEYYRRAGRFVLVNGEGSVAEVFERLQRAIREA